MGLRKLPRPWILRLEASRRVELSAQRWDPGQCGRQNPSGQKDVNPRDRELPSCVLYFPIQSLETKGDVGIKDRMLESKTSSENPELIVAMLIVVQVRSQSFPYLGEMFPKMSHLPQP